MGGWHLQPDCNMPVSYTHLITGIGFLGAGTIFVRKQVINGLTTAAGLWTTSGIGMAIGAGMYIVGVTIKMCIRDSTFSAP